MWFWLAFGAAILGAIDIILNKKLLHRVSPATLNWALYAFSLPILIPLALRSGIPSLNFIFWMAIVLSSITFVIGRTIYNDALKNNLVSDIIPITAFSGVFIYLLGLMFLSETIRLIPLLGLSLVIIGSYILNVDQAREGILRPFKLLFRTKAAMLLLLAIVLTSITAIFDKMGVINTSPTNPLFVILLENILEVSLLTIYLVKQERKTWIKEVKSNYKLLFINSIVYLAVGWVVFSAYQSGPVALIIGIKRLQIFFALILGYLLLKDKPGKHTWIATAVMILGVILIKIG